MMMIFEWCWIVMDFTTKSLQRVPKTAKVETSGGCFLSKVMSLAEFEAFKILFCLLTELEEWAFCDFHSD